MEQFNPLAILCSSHLAGVAAVAAKQIEILGQVEVNGPLVALHVEGSALAGLQVVSRQKEILALGILPVVPDRFTVEAPELVPRNFHQHGSLVISVLCVPSVWII